MAAAAAAGETQGRKEEKKGSDVPKSAKRALYLPIKQETRTALSASPSAKAKGHIAAQQQHPLQKRNRQVPWLTDKGHLSQKKKPSARERGRERREKRGASSVPPPCMLKVTLGGRSATGCLFQQDLKGQGSIQAGPKYGPPEWSKLCRVTQVTIPGTVRSEQSPCGRSAVPSMVASWRAWALGPWRTQGVGGGGEGQMSDENKSVCCIKENP